jgi:hypothetical protein
MRGWPVSWQKQRKTREARLDPGTSRVLSRSFLFYSRAHKSRSIRFSRIFKSLSFRSSNRAIISFNAFALLLLHLVLLLSLSPPEPHPELLPETALSLL